MTNIKPKRLYNLIFIALTLSFLTACGGGESNSVTGDNQTGIIYVKRKIDALGNPTEAVRFRPGGDLFFKRNSTADAKEHNITHIITAGQGDVSDPEVSYDGKTVVFAAKLSATESWDIWQYDIQNQQLSVIIEDPEHDDIDPAYLPGGGIVFSSNRQQSGLDNGAAEGYPENTKQLDVPQRETLFNLHVYDPTGDIRQISFNQGHDRNPSVHSSGKIIFSRWINFGNRNQVSIYSVNPDGTDLNIFYGAHSPGQAFMQPREAQNGMLIASIVPLSGSYEGGAIVSIDTKNYDEAYVPNSANHASHNRQSSGQTLLTSNINFTDPRSLSQNGRYTSPYPIGDGSGRILTSYSVSRPVEQVDFYSNAIHTVEDRPFYNLVILDPSSGQQEILVRAKPGIAVVDGVVVQSRPLPRVIPEQSENNPSRIFIRSVYDTDVLERMGNAVTLTPEKPNSDPDKEEKIPTLANPNPIERRQQIANISALKDPLITAPDERPARFVRVTKAVPMAEHSVTNLVGHSQYKMQQILGYSPVEPDGSVLLTLPDGTNNCNNLSSAPNKKIAVDSAIALSVVDAQGRAFQNHSSWLQVRAGETLSCNGCHSPRRGNSINQGTITTSHINSKAELQPLPGEEETMAQTRDRIRQEDPALAQQLGLGSSELSANLFYEDIWSDDSQANIKKGKQISISYDHLTNIGGAPLLTGQAIEKLNCGIINYEEHIQPLWEAQRGFGDQFTCTRCHNDLNPAAGLSLENSRDARGRLQSYSALLLGAEELDENGDPILLQENGFVRTKRRPASVRTSNNVNGGLARGSYIIELLNNKELRAPQSLPQDNDHHNGTMLEAELRLISEWIDLGAQYYNQAYPDNATALRLQKKPNRQDFETIISPIFAKRCATCHQYEKSQMTVIGATTITEVNDSDGNRFYLSGDPDKDYNATVAMIDNYNNAQTARLLRVPTNTDHHPALMDENGELTPVLETHTRVDGELTDYGKIIGWIINASTQ